MSSILTKDLMEAKTFGKNHYFNSEMDALALRHCSGTAEKNNRFVVRISCVSMRVLELTAPCPEAARTHP